jgi:hypothetical protein
MPSPLWRTGISARPAPLDLDAPALGRELRGVVQQVRQHLRQPVDVAGHDEPDRARDAQLVAARLDQRHRGLDRARHHVAQLDRMPFDHDLALRDAADVEQVVDEPRQVRDLPLDHAGGPPHAVGRERRRQQQVRGVADRRERIAQLVREHREELVHALRVGLESLDALALGHVARDLREAAQVAVVVAQRGQHHVGPEVGAVLADAPTFLLEAAGVARDLELALRHALRDRVGRIERREMPADDLGCAVALDQRGAGVPGAHDARDVEHEDRVVAHALDDQAGALLAAPQRLLVLAALGEVAGDLREAPQRAVGVAQRGDDDVRPEQRAVLADAPALVLEAPELGRALELDLGPAARIRLGRVEHREVLADDLGSRVALDAPRAGVPRQHVAGGAQHEDGVVGHALDERAEELRLDGLGPARGRVRLHGCVVRVRKHSPSSARGDHTANLNGSSRFVRPRGPLRAAFRAAATR